MTRKSSFPEPLSWTIHNPECSVNEKIPKNLVWPKKVGALTPPLKNSESTVLCNKEITKKFWPQIKHDLKELVPGSPYSELFRVQSTM